MSTNLTLTVEHNGLQLTATLPEVFSALAPILPIATKLFGSKKDQAVSSRDLHAALDVARDHSTWVSGIFKQYNLVEDVDYVVERLDKADPANWPAIKANGGKVPTVFLFPPKVAAMIATFTKTAMGKQVWDYMYAVTDAAHDAIEHHYQKQLSATQEHLEGEKRHNKAQREHNNLLAEKLGHHGVPQAVNMALELKAAHQALADLRSSKGDGGYALEAYERAIEAGALRLKKVKNNPSKIEDAADEFMKTLEEVRGGNATYRSCF